MLSEFPLSFETSNAASSLDKNLSASVADSTHKTYAYWWNRFQRFCQDIGENPAKASEDFLLWFLSLLTDSVQDRSSVRQARAAIKHFWVIAGRCTSPIGEVGVSKLDCGIDRPFFKPVTKSGAISEQEFLGFLRHTTGDGDFANTKFTHLRLAAQVALMFGAKARFKESVELKVSQLHLPSPSLSLGTPVKVLFKKGKTYQMGEVRSAVISGRPCSNLFLVSLLDSYVERLKELPGNDDCWLFPGVRWEGGKFGTLASLNKPVGYNVVVQGFKKACEEAGLTRTDGSSLTLHSLRRGAVTIAANEGVAEHETMKQMRVKGVSTVHNYISLNEKSPSREANSLF